MQTEPSPHAAQGPASTPAVAHGFGLSHDPWGRVVLIDSDGQRFVGVEPVRAFPITHPRGWVAICDAEGREILMIESLDALAPGLRQTLEAELALREFIPVIEQIERQSDDAFPCDWDVITDRGPTRFTVDNEEDIRLLGGGRVIITDARRLRYQIKDVATLDRASRRLLERFL
jgi:hypothetical protein